LHVTNIKGSTECLRIHRVSPSFSLTCSQPAAFALSMPATLVSCSAMITRWSDNKLSHDTRDIMQTFDPFPPPSPLPLPLFPLVLLPFLFFPLLSLLSSSLLAFLDSFHLAHITLSSHAITNISSCLTRVCHYA